jgi:5-hydroxyisourate hydrolase-like protein (transthyretin family)
VEGGDHWIPCVGYDKAAGKYYYYNTYDTTLRNAPIAYTGSTPGAGDYAISFVRTVTYIPKSVGYSVNIWAFANNEGWLDWIPITKDGAATGYNTPHNFTGLTGTHTFTVPANDGYGRLFYKWSTGWTGRTLTVNSTGTYTAYYRWGTLTVTVPNGGENWVRDAYHLIKWTSTGSPGANVKIELLKGGVVNKVISSSTANDGIYGAWKISSTQTLGTDYKIRITSTTYSIATDSSNNNFAIVRGTLTVTSPNGAEKWIRGTTHTITWSKAGTTGSYVKIELLKGGVVNRVISSSTLNDGSYSWTIPSTQTLGTDYKIRITSTTYTSITDSSNSNFSIIT